VAASAAPSPRRPVAPSVTPTGGLGDRATAGEKGYTLVAVVIGMAILAILTAAVAPAVSMIMQEDREEELIFRGRQYARGMALFQKRYGRFPTSLKEMYENRPRTIRKLWKDPMCNCDDWELIVLGIPGAQVVPPGGGARLPAPTPRPTPTVNPFGGSSQTKNVGPIVGVRSKVKKKSLRQWRGQSSYDLWEFRVGDADRSDLMSPGLLPPGAPPPPGYSGK
jgi:type II secretory pathway pseudopilin PulG